MLIAFGVVNVLLALGMAWCGFAEFTLFDGLPAQMTRAGVPLSWMPWLAAVKVVALVGIVVGFAVPVIGTATALGVAVYFVAAFVKHLMARDPNVGGAVFFFVLASAALTLRVVASAAFGLGVLAA
ncbi:MAG TPA: DoxX family protein [Chloroflexota bacterium]|nr:DoxX family protein [Chloroflexota bacterium]